MYNKHINLLVERTWQNIAADCAYLMYFILGLFQWELYILYKYIYMHVCVYEREREREREIPLLGVLFSVKKNVFHVLSILEMFA